MMAMDATMYPDDPAYRQGMRRGLILGINDWYSSGNYYIDEVEIEACFDKYAETDKTIYIYNPDLRQIECYEFGPGKIGVQLDSEFVVPELRFWLNSETYKLKMDNGMLE